MARSEVHLFLIWSNARARETEIIDDIAARFAVLDLIEVEWSREAFGRNLTCFYGADLPPGSNKERECGTDPFLVCVVEDERPRHRFRRVGWRVVRENRRIMEARARYRSLSGGGYAVHASADHREAERDLVLLFGRRPSEFLSSRTNVHQPPRRHTADVLGAHGWRDIDELMLALDVTAKARRVDPGADVDVAVVVDDVWWAEHVTNGVFVRPGVWKIDVGGSACLVEIRPSA